jgi:hypothetical protein
MWTIRFLVPAPLGQLLDRANNDIDVRTDRRHLTVPRLASGSYGIRRVRWVRKGRRVREAFAAA